MFVHVAAAIESVIKAFVAGDRLADEQIAALSKSVNFSHASFQQFCKVCSSPSAMDVAKVFINLQALFLAALDGFPPIVSATFV